MIWRGFSLIEISIALGVFAVLVPAFIFSLGTTTNLQVTNRALLPAIDLVSASSTNFARAAALGNHLPSNLSLPDPDAWRFPLTLQWRTPHGEEVVGAVARLTDPGHPLGSCDPFPSTPWETLRAGTSRELSATDLLQGEPSDGYRVSGITWGQNLAVVTIQSTGSPTSPTIAFLPMERFGELGTSIAAFDNASTSRIGYSAAVVSGDYIYAANRFGSSARCLADSCAQIHRYSLTDEPRLDGFLLLATTTSPFAYRVGGATAGATSLAAQGNLLAVGLERTDLGFEFNLVRTADLAWVGGLRVGRSISAISLRGGRAYLATDDPDRELIVVNIEDPTSPYIEHFWDAPGARGFGLGSAVLVFGNTVALGRSYVANAGEFALLTEHLPEALSLTGVWDPGTASEPESVRALEAIDWALFVLGIHSLTALVHHDGQASSRAVVSLPAGWEGVAMRCVGATLLVGLVHPATGASQIVQYHGN